VGQRGPHPRERKPAVIIGDFRTEIGLPFGGCRINIAARVIEIVRQGVLPG